MNSSTCPHEFAVSRAARGGLWTEGLREHATGCRVCRDTAAVSGWLRNAARLDGISRSGLDPQLIWLHSRAVEKERAAEKTLLPVRAAEALDGFAAFAALVTGLALRGPELMRALKSGVSWSQDAALATIEGVAGYQAGAAALAIPAMILIVALSILLAAAYPLLSED